ncbi:BMP family ABC transporter substrate-binding protein [Candidatus Mycoplasma mahonii]|uniref:BMP family ABC transporter substrate-binding protein n=1 Tax=Candidatus Mycoplasma mahonii TaxID=3004105 RepID=UPI0026F1E1B1|nr:BMP family ABC transporter substrate-binding protein [Candidatus Mycoplasma mahonii]WKX02258.1 BMP family ABC transporter substrate-binding protein [Candidatus Mycoplasma mahonii]
MQKLNKILLNIGAMGAILTSVTAAVACGSSSGGIKNIPYYESTVVQTDMNMANTFFVSDGGSIKDKSFNESSLTGMQEARGVTGEGIFTSNVKSPSEPSEILNNYSSVKTSGGKLIVASGFHHNGPLSKFAPANPNMGFVFVDGTLDVERENKTMVQAANVASIVFDMKAPSFVMGVLAAAKALSVDEVTPNIGVYGGANIPPVTAFINPFKAGIGYFNEHLKALSAPDVAIEDGGFVDNFNVGGKSKTAADLLASEGVELLMAVGGPQYNDALAAVKATSHGQIIGVDVILHNIIGSSDQALVFGSITKALKKATKDTINAIYDNVSTLGLGKIYTGKLSNQGSGISLAGIDKTSLADMKASLKAATNVNDSEIAEIIAAANAVR